MATVIPPDPKRAMRQNLDFLREYARRVILEEDESLVILDDIKETLVQQLKEAGESFSLTERDLMVLLYRGILDQDQ